METKHLVISFAILYVVTGVAIGIFHLFITFIIRWETDFNKFWLKALVFITPDTMPIIRPIPHPLPHPLRHPLRHPLPNLTCSSHYRTKSLLTVSVTISSINNSFIH